MTGKKLRTGSLLDMSKNTRDSEAPEFIYGTAWKGQDTRRLTRLSLEEGFRSIDTANQPKHYNEPGVGKAITDLTTNGPVAREDLFVQTKFTHPGAQGESIPYNSSADPRERVYESFSSSTEHLGVNYLDSYLLHGPRSQGKLDKVDRVTWRTMEELAESDKVKELGICNVSAKQLEELLSFSKISPDYVQNRCFARTGWDGEVRKICFERGVDYQGFSLLTANQNELRSIPIQDLAAKRDITVPQLIFRFALQVNIIPLTGTTSQKHMRQDLECLDFELTGEEVREVENISF